MINLWTVGREREKLHAANFARKPSDQAALFPVIERVHDLIDGTCSPDDFVNAARLAITEGGFPAWTNAANWMRQVGNRLPEVNELWLELSHSPDWKVRWRVACCLYLDIPEPFSDRIFAVFRSDRSKKVRDYAISRYEERPDKSGLVSKLYDASEFDNRIARGEVAV